MSHGWPKNYSCMHMHEYFSVPRYNRCNLFSLESYVVYQIIVITSLLLQPFSFDLYLLLPPHKELKPNLGQHGITFVQATQQDAMCVTVKISPVCDCCLFVKPSDYYALSLYGVSVTPYSPNANASTLFTNVRCSVTVSGRELSDCW